MQAVLVVAHKDAEQIIELSKILTRKFEVYIHFDTKYRIPAKFAEILKSMAHVHLFQKIAVNWGAYSIVEAELLLLREAMKNPDISYFHIISGQDWPVRSPEEIYDFYEGTDKIYMTYAEAETVTKSCEPTIWWQKYYFYYDDIKRKTVWGKIYHRLSFLWQTAKRTDKFKDLGISLKIYKGSNWCDLPRYAVDYLLKYLEENPNFEKMLRTGFCSDEFIYQTALCNSSYREKIVNNYHRYRLFVKKNGSYPAILDETDFSSIEAGNYHFARKIDLKISEKLIRQLALSNEERELNNETD